MPEAKHDDGWNEYQKLVMSELQRHSAWLALLDKKAQKIRVDLTRLQVKAAMIGGIAGLVPAIAAVLVSILK